MSLKIEGVSKQYKGNNSLALNNLSIEIEPGVMGLLGPNGAGKSTLMRIIATITKPTSGTVYYNGVDISQNPETVRKFLGYLPQDFGVYPNLNADEFLQYLAAIKGIDAGSAKQRIDDLLTFVDLLEARRRPLGSYSGGMKQRIGIAQALLNDPLILIVDEPTVGLDPEGRLRFRHLLAELSGERIVILSTHIVSDVEAVANDIAIINQGHLVQRSSSEDLLKLVDGKIWDWVIPSSNLQAVKQKHLLSNVIRRKDGLKVRAIADERPVQEAQYVESPTLEEAYLYCISHEIGRDTV